MTGSTTKSCYVGVDVGTGSVRASIVTKSGKVLASSTQETKTWRDPHDHRVFEQSTTDIWSRIGVAIKDCLSASGVEPSAVKGLGFDATCSLAVTDFEGEPVIVTKGEEIGGHGERNTILWADHRAEEEAELINRTGSVVLDYVGGKMSLEMEVPKVLWLKKHMSPEHFHKCQFFDLPDFLTYQATRDSSRSTCSLTCKCSYVANSGWQKEFFEQIGLEELSEREYAQMGPKDGEEVLIAGMPVGEGLSKKAAEELGLRPGTPVGSAIIDAYAGWLGTIAARFADDKQELSEVPTIEESGHRLAAVAGTSTCHIVQSPSDIFVNGVWGPYKDPILSGWWMNEGGQSSTGQLIDFILTTHPAYPELVELGKKNQKPIHTVLEERLEKLRTESAVETLTELTKDLHLYPDLHGNRSPIADPRMRGSIVGLELSNSLNDLAKKYHATLLAIALQTRHIIDTLNGAGHHISAIYMSGGQAKNAGLMQLFADVCGMPVVLPRDSGGAVVLGAAMLGRLAVEFAQGEGGSRGKLKEGQAERLWGIMVEMTPPGTLVSPKASPREKKLLEAKYKIFLESIEIQKRWRKEIEDATK
ncbi:unnamed protein product [Cyclocybe aegerita]|uniref:Pentulose kinase n=1 Tax=Cyclocybe aegerita TaxID=1973307 RepID=A0A8S0XQW7_CYCAE|nr:unnamed protein product [Cyclocybe aegerita]